VFFSIFFWFFVLFCIAFVLNISLLPIILWTRWRGSGPLVPEIRFMLEPKPGRRLSVVVKRFCLNYDLLSSETVCMGEPRETRKGAAVAYVFSAWGVAEARKGLRMLAGALFPLPGSALKPD
jgi:hypothetical protein